MVHRQVKLYLAVIAFTTPQMSQPTTKTLKHVACEDTDAGWCHEKEKRVIELQPLAICGDMSTLSFACLSAFPGERLPLGKLSSAP